MFRSARPLISIFRPSKIRFDPRDQNFYVSTKFDQARYVSISTTPKFCVLTKFDQARYVLNGATKISRFGPSSTKRYLFRSARPRTSMFRPNSTQRDTFRPAQSKYLCFDHVRPSEIRFDRRDQSLFVSTKFDQI